MFSCLSADDSLPFPSMEALSVLWIIFHDFSSREWACSEEKRVSQNDGWLVISLVPSPFPPRLTAGAVDGTALLGIRAKSLGSVRVFGWHLCGTNLLNFGTRRGTRLVGTTGSGRFAPNSLWPNLSFVFYLQDRFCFNDVKSRLEGQLEGGVCL